ncbi:hypothetical protein Tco_1301994 [Tanacetum coccineum]
MASKTITLTLLHISKTLSFDLDNFSSDIGLEPSDDCVFVPPKETVKAGPATLGLVDEDHPSFSYQFVSGEGDVFSTDLEATTFRSTWKNETNLTSHMFKVADLSPKPIQSLLPLSREVYAIDTADKSLFGTFVLPVTQPKAKTAKRPRKKKILSST